MTAIHYPEPDYIAEAPPPPITAIEPPTPRRLGRRTTGLIVALVVTLVVAGVTWSATTRPEPAPDVHVAGFAEMYVRTFLTQAGEGNEAAIAPFLGYTPILTGMRSGSYYVAGATTIATVTERDNSTRATIAVDQLGAVAGGFAPDGLAYYEVVVVHGPDGVRAEGLPARVAAPALAATNTTPPALAPPVDGPMPTAVAHYLEWLLIGGEGSYLAARPAAPPYESIQLLAISAPGEAGTVHAVVAGTDDAGRVTTLQYEISIADESGVWIAGP